MKMKTWFGLSFAAVLLASCTQNSYKVNYTTDEADVEKIYLYDETTGEKLDSAVCENGVAVIEGEMELPVFAAIGTGMPGRKLCKVIIDNTPTEITYTAENGFDVKGSETNSNYRNIVSQISVFAKSERELMSKARQIAMENGGYLPDSISMQMQKEYTEIQESRAQVIKEAIEANKENIIPAGLLAAYYSLLDIKEVEEFLATYKYGQHATLEKLNNYIQGLKNREVGAMFVDFTMNDMEGNPRKLSDYVGQGNYVLVDFWASWCGPCRAEMPNVKAAYEQFHPKGFEIVGISLDNNKEAWEKATEQMGITWPQMSDLKGWQCEAVDLYGIRGIPATILYGPDGKVVAANLRAAALQQKLEEIYQ